MIAKMSILNYHFVLVIILFTSTSCGLALNKFQKLSNFQVKSCENSCKNGVCRWVDQRLGFKTIKCHCFPGYTGQTCDQSDCKPACKHGKCVTKSTIKFCLCKRGFSGPDCNNVNWNVLLGIAENPNIRTDINNKVNFQIQQGANLCAPNFVCQNGGVCVRINRGVGCRCVGPYTGTFCTDRCNKTCENNGRCYLNRGSPVCNCPWGYTGEFCHKRKITQATQLLP